ncbi:Na+/H+ antiporter NhaA [Aquihabitans sp. McL0605]|uniref:Na+/H+ antiporter NhaA n=1 Tax=Aquihabitans sp. McL0605 TaxID=3415671 RepID=UPI003CFAEB38
MDQPSIGTSPDLPRTWIDSDRPLARAVGRPVQQFMGIEASGGIVLVAAAVVAMVWANSPWQASYVTVFHTHLNVDLGSFHYNETLVHFINDGLMALFFFVVGLEIKREWVAGELRDRRAAILPAVAALGGMIVPALIYLAFNAGGAGADGWGIPMATDIAFALGVVALLGSRVPSPLKIFLLTLAIVDDIGAIIVIAVFYTDDFAGRWLLGAGLVILAVMAARRAKVRYHVVYVVLGAALWFCILESGVHATIAGVIMGLLTPAIATLSDDDAQIVVDELEDRDDLTAADVHRVSILISEAVPLTERLEHLLHPWTSYLIVPVFALANAGIVVTSHGLTNPSSITLGVIVGLVVGKTVGVSLFSWLAVKLRLGVLPEGVRFIQLVGIAMLAGIGFTVSLFVSSLAFDFGSELRDAKIGILLASMVAAIAGSVMLILTADPDAADDGPPPPDPSPPAVP